MHLSNSRFRQSADTFKFELKMKERVLYNQYLNKVGKGSFETLTSTQFTF